MIVIWFRHRGQRPSRTDAIQEDATKAATLPSPFNIVGVTYGRSVDDEYRSDHFGLRVNSPSDSISTEAVTAIGTAFEDNWGGTVEHVETIVE